MPADGAAGCKESGIMIKTGRLVNISAIDRDLTGYAPCFLRLQHQPKVCK